MFLRRPRHTRPSLRVRFTRFLFSIRTRSARRRLSLRHLVRVARHLVHGGLHHLLGDDRWRRRRPGVRLRLRVPWRRHQCTVLHLPRRADRVLGRSGADASSGCRRVEPIRSDDRATRHRHRARAPDPLSRPRASRDALASFERASRPTRRCRAAVRRATACDASVATRSSAGARVRRHFAPRLAAWPRWPSRPTSRRTPRRRR